MGIFSSCKRDEIKDKPADPKTGATPKSTSKSKYQPKETFVFYSIPAGTIADHSDATITGSIAWYLATYGGGTATSPNTFYLSTNGTYTCQRTITLPAYARISEGTGVTEAVIQCDPATNWQKMVGYDNMLLHMYTGSMLMNVELRLNWKAGIGVYANGANGVRILDVAISNSAKAPKTEGVSYLTYIVDSDNIIIDQCLLRRAGCENTESIFERWGYCIQLIRGNNGTISNNDLETSTSAGLAFFQSTNLKIDNNLIQDTGRANVPEFAADGITSYHEGLGTLSRDILIKNNTIRDSKNHGMHVSGYGITITGNNISGSKGGANIYLGDQRMPPDCSADIWVTGNTLGPQKAAYSIYRNHVISSRIYISDNTGSTSVQPAIDCTYFKW